MTFLTDVTGDRMNQYLLELKDKGRTNRTCNAYLVAMQGFCTWSVREGRLPSSPVAHLVKLNEDEDEDARPRRALSQAEFEQLIATAESSDTIYRRGKLTGSDRAMLYLFAVGTGLRAGEIASLTADSLHLDDDFPYVVVKAAYSKRRRRDEQPLPVWLAVNLRAWLAAKPETQQLDRPLWPGSWHDRAAEMLRIDLDAAEVPYVDDRGEYFDFHALRGQYITALSRAGILPQSTRQLARHSTIDLTLKHYTHLVRSDTAMALGALPDPLGNGVLEADCANGADADVVVQELSEQWQEGGILTQMANWASDQIAA